MVLAYPAQPNEPPRPVGTCVVFERALVDDVHVVGIEIEGRFISRKGALREFSANVSAGIAGLFL